MVQQLQPDGGSYTFSYVLGAGGNVTETDLTDPIGSVEQIALNQNGYCQSDTVAVGKPEQQQITYNRDPNSNLILSSTDALARTSSYTYDSRSNVTSITRLSGTSQAATTSYTYDPIFSRVLSVTDPLSHTWTLSRDSHGNLTGISDPLGHQATASYNSAGQVTSLTDSAGDTVHLGYSDGELTSETDPLGNTSFLFSDDAGRLIWMQDPLGNATNLSYSPLDDVTQIIDASGKTTSFSYDHMRNLLSVTDANGGTTAYGYDSMARRISRTDPLSHADSYQYDGNSNLTQFTDRRGKITVYQYDGLNRRIFAGFGQNGSSYESTINYTLDGGDRMTQAVDSIAGTITRSYDGLDDLLAETTPQGSLTWSYDSARRRSSMQVAGQPAVSYSWDNANRLTAIVQGSNSVGFAYDAANRRTTLTLPNGIALSYAYDNDSRVTAMSWMAGLSQVGDLEYFYDADGRVVEKTGTFAQTNVPQPVSGNAFNLANEMTVFNGTALTYDLNGNLTNDGTNTYSWDARNHLASLNGANAASFMYDPTGRRAQKTINGVSTQFLYDGSNPVQEIQNGAPSANLLTGLGIDEYFQRTDAANGAMTLMTDTLGSTLALSDSSGTVQTQYTYQPFGTATSSGNANANSYQFTGRENDGTGLYAYRARYYSPTLQRFIAQDPIGFLGGSASLYAYVRENPINSIDRLGLLPGGGPNAQYQNAPSAPSGPAGWSGFFICAGGYTFAVPWIPVGAVVLGASCFGGDVPGCVAGAAFGGAYFTMLAHCYSNAFPKSCSEPAPPAQFPEWGESTAPEVEGPRPGERLPPVE